MAIRGRAPDALEFIWRDEFGEGVPAPGADATSPAIVTRHNASTEVHVEAAAPRSVGSAAAANGRPVFSSVDRRDPVARGGASARKAFDVGAPQDVDAVAPTPAAHLHPGGRLHVTPTIDDVRTVEDDARMVDEVARTVDDDARMIDEVVRVVDDDARMVDDDARTVLVTAGYKAAEAREAVKR